MPASTPKTSNSPPGRFTPLWSGLAYGLLVYLSLPPVSLWPLTFAAVGVLLWAACRAGAAGGVGGGGGGGGGGIGGVGGGPSPRRAAFLFGLGTLPLWFAEQAWLLNVTQVGYPLLAIYLAAWSALTVYLLAVVRTCGRRVPMVVAAPLVCVAVSVLRGEVVLSGYPWFLAAHPLIDSPRLAAPAAVFGVYFVSFLVIALAGSLADAAGWSGVQRRWGGVGAGVVLIVWIAASIVGREGEGPANTQRELRVGVVQTDVPQGAKMQWSTDSITSDFGRFMVLTRKLTDNQPAPQLILWPETMFPGNSLNAPAVEVFEAVVRANHPEISSDEQSLNMLLVRALLRLQTESRIPMLIGSDEIDGARLERGPDGKAKFAYDHKYNSVVLLDNGKVSAARYDKIALTPFGEVIPVVWRWPSVQQEVLSLGASGMKFDLSVGRHPDPITIPGLTIDGREVAAATPICFEVTRSDLCRRLVYGGPHGKRRADLMINLSNDGWFGDITDAPVPSDAGRYQHLLIARWRCVELGVPMVRAVNTGVSGAIDNAGKMLPLAAVEPLKSPTRSDGAMIATVDLTDRTTIFGSIGNSFAWVTLCAGSALAAWAWIVGRRSRAIGRRLR